MAPKSCSDCGSQLTGSLFSSKCVNCFRVPYARAKAFFDTTPLTEQDIQNWKSSRFYMTSLAYALFLFAFIILGCLIGYGKGGTYTGLGYAFVATLLGILIFRWRMSRVTVHPLSTQQWFNFAFPYTLILFFPWAFAYLAWMPTYAGGLIAAGSIFSHHVQITSTVTVPAFSLTLLVGIVAAVVGALVSFWIALRQETKIKAHLIAQYQRWQQVK